MSHRLLNLPALSKVQHNLTYLLVNKSHHKIVAFPLNYEAIEAISNSEICCPKLGSRTYFVFYKLCVLFNMKYSQVHYANVLICHMEELVEY